MASFSSCLSNKKKSIGSTFLGTNPLPEVVLVSAGYSSPLSRVGTAWAAFCCQWYRRGEARPQTNTSLSSRKFPSGLLRQYSSEIIKKVCQNLKLCPIASSCAISCHSDKFIQANTPGLSGGKSCTRSGFSSKWILKSGWLLFSSKTVSYWMMAQ